jgi:hypothetical protein
VPDARVLPIRFGEHGLTAPDRVPPGSTTFRSETSVAGGGWVGLARFEQGTDWADFRESLRDTVSDDQERIVKGMAALDGTAVLLGGAVVHPGKPAEFTVDLGVGQHVLFDYPDTAGAGPSSRFRLLSVEGRPSGATPATPAGTIRAVHTAEGPRFEVLGNPSAHQPLAFENAMERPYVMEAVLFPLPPAVGDRELAEFAAKFVDGSPEWPEPPFEVNAGFGCLPLSAGQRTVMRFTAKSGRYVVADWLKDPADGVRMVKRGHHRIIELS